MPKKDCKKDDIEQFLKEFKSCWNGNVLDERQDQKNDETLGSLGIKPGHRAEEVRALKYINYSEGPSPDHANPLHNIWVFGKKVKGEDIYIKIKVVRKPNGGKYGKCLSFHIAERPIKYPCKK